MPRKLLSLASISPTKILEQSKGHSGVVAGCLALACSRAEAPMVFDLFDQSGLCILPRSQPMPSATIAVV
jgi:hypothetical protein